MGTVTTSGLFFSGPPQYLNAIALLVKSFDRIPKDREGGRTCTMLLELGVDVVHMLGYSGPSWLVFLLLRLVPVVDFDDGIGRRLNMANVGYLKI